MSRPTGGGAATAAASPHRIDELFTLRSSRLHLFAAIALVYALVEGIEAVGLWYAKRWAEYLTLIVTASLLPVEVYELSEHATPFKILALIVNVAVVAYLLYAKRLFGLRGGAAADEELAARDVGWPALEAGVPEPEPARSDLDGVTVRRRLGAGWARLATSSVRRQAHRPAAAETPRAWAPLRTPNVRSQAHPRSAGARGPAQRARRGDQALLSAGAGAGAAPSLMP